VTETIDATAGTLDVSPSCQSIRSEGHIRIDESPSLSGSDVRRSIHPFAPCRRHLQTGHL